MEYFHYFQMIMKKKHQTNQHLPAQSYQINNRTSCEIYWRRSGVFIVNFEHVIGCETNQIS